MYQLKWCNFVVVSSFFFSLSLSFKHEIIKKKRKNFFYLLLLLLLLSILYFLSCNKYNNNRKKNCSKLIYVYLMSIFFFYEKREEELIENIIIIIIQKKKKARNCFFTIPHICVVFWLPEKKDGLIINIMFAFASFFLLFFAAFWITRCCIYSVFISK